MCEFCTQHGQGKKWYLSANNYSLEVQEKNRFLKDLDSFGKNFNKTVNMARQLLSRIENLPLPLKNKGLAFHEKMQKKFHFGQVVPLEDILKILDMMNSVVLLPCICRYYYTGKAHSYCLGVTLDIMGDGFSQGINKSFSHIPHFTGLEDMTGDEVVSLVKKFDEIGLVHTVWTFNTPFIYSICNCEMQSCAGLDLSRQGLRVMFNGEYVAVIDPEKCTACGLCVKRCSFSAIFRNDTDRIIILDPTHCTGCGLCRTVCPRNAITLIERRKHTLANSIWYPPAGNP